MHFTLTIGIGWDILNTVLIKKIFFSNSIEYQITVSPGSSVVEHVPEEHSVGGSIPSLGTIHLQGK